MASQIPAEVNILLTASDDTVRGRAWEGFVRKYRRLISHAARSLGGDYETSMDRYTLVLEQLRADDFRRLRPYSSQPDAKFTTWLTVVARRICADHSRSRYGRRRANDNPSGFVSDEIRTRRRLADLIADEFDIDMMADEAAPDSSHRLSRAELFGAVEDALRGLPVRDRLLLALRFEEDSPAREIADVMGFPSRFRVYRHSKAVVTGLRQKLQSKGIEMIHTQPRKRGS
jgi:RNA polymerase sigma factor (sigma-70 family)